MSTECNIMYDSLNVLFLKTCLYIISEKNGSSFFRYGTGGQKRGKKNPVNQFVCANFSRRVSLKCYMRFLFIPLKFLAQTCLLLGSIHLLPATVHLSGGSSLFPAVACFFFWHSLRLIAFQLTLVASLLCYSDTCILHSLLPVSKSIFPGRRKKSQSRT